MLLLEKGLNAELQKEAFAGERANEIPSKETGPKVLHVPSSSTVEINQQAINHLPQLQMITQDEIKADACDDKPDRLEIARLYNDMCKVLEDSSAESIEAHMANQPASFKLKKNLHPLETISGELIKILPCSAKLSLFGSGDG